MNIAIKKETIREGENKIKKVEKAEREEPTRNSFAAFR
jgi:hypothetical protein